MLLVKEPRGQLTNFFLGSAPGHPFWEFALLQLRASAQIPDPVFATGPAWLHATWSSFVQATAAAGCFRSVARSTHIFNYDEFQRSLGAHHWAGTWHDAKLWPRGVDGAEQPSEHRSKARRRETEASARYDPTLLQWLRVNRSNTCQEGKFQELITKQWSCRNKGNPCPRTTWAEYMRACEGTIRGCRPRVNLTEAERVQLAALKQYWAS